MIVDTSHIINRSSLMAFIREGTFSLFFPVFSSRLISPSCHATSCPYPSFNTCQTTKKGGITSCDRYFRRLIESSRFMSVRCSPDILFFSFLSNQRKTQPSLPRSLQRSKVVQNKRNRHCEIILETLQIGRACGISEQDESRNSSRSTWPNREAVQRNWYVFCLPLSLSSFEMND